MRFEVLTAVSFMIAIFLDVIMCHLGDRYQRFGGTYRFHLQGRRTVPSRRKGVLGLGPWAWVKETKQEGSGFLQNVDTHLPVYTVSHPTRLIL
jgi:hypothetical protein